MHKQPGGELLEFTEGKDATYINYMQENEAYLRMWNELAREHAYIKKDVAALALFATNFVSIEAAVEYAVLCDEETKKMMHGFVRCLPDEP